MDIFLTWAYFLWRHFSLSPFIQQYRAETKTENIIFWRTAELTYALHTFGRPKRLTNANINGPEGSYVIHLNVYPTTRVHRAVGRPRIVECRWQLVYWTPIPHRSAINPRKWPCRRHTSVTFLMATRETGIGARINVFQLEKVCWTYPRGVCKIIKAEWKIKQNIFPITFLATFQSLSFRFCKYVFEFNNIFFSY